MHGAMTPTRRWFAVVFVLYLAIQIAFPVYRLFQPRPTRFGWQMFSAASVPSRVWLVEGDQLHEISPASYIGNARADLEWERYALPHLCHVRSDSTAIKYLMPLDPVVREYRC